MADSREMSNTPNSPSQPTSSRTGVTGGVTRTGPDGTHAVAEAKEVGTQLVGAVREGANSFFEEQRDRAAGEIASLGEMLRRSARTLDQDRATTVGRYAEDAADQITQFAERLRNRSFGMMADELEDFARRWPVAFIAAAVGAGFAAGRFLVSSGSRFQPTTRPMPGALAARNQSAVGGARHDFGAVGGSVSGGNAGYGAPGVRETR